MHFAEAIKSMSQNFRSKSLIYDKNHHQQSAINKKKEKSWRWGGREKREITRRYVGLAPARLQVL